MSRKRERRKRTRRKVWFLARRAMPLETITSLWMDQMLYGVATAEVVWTPMDGLLAPRARRIPPPKPES